MKAKLFSLIDVEVHDEDLISMLKNKRDELLSFHEYAEVDEDGKYYLWKNEGDNSSDEKIEYIKGLEISKTHYDMLEMLTKLIYAYNNHLKEKKHIEEESEYFRLKEIRANQKNLY